VLDRRHLPPADCRPGRFCAAVRRAAGASIIPMSTWSPSPRSGSSEPLRDDAADDKRDAEAAEVERLREEGKTVIGIGWGDPDDGKTIEHEANPQPSNRD
jgi:hypothetical protein